MLSWGQGGSPSQFLDHWKQVCFQQTQNQSLQQLFLKVSWDLCPKLSFCLCSYGGNVRGEVKALEGHHVSSKSPSMVQDGDEGVMGRNGRE